MFSSSPPVPTPTLDDESAPLPESELLVAPVPAGRDVTLCFASPFELFLTLDGRRVTKHVDAAERRVLVWAHRRLPALYGALEERLGLRAMLTDEDVVVTDACELSSGSFLDHTRLRQLLSGAGVALPPLAVLGPLATRTELKERLRALYAVGTPVEVRAEEDGRVTSRRRLQVGREMRA